jgi:class 3 adenylate cyclase
MTTRRLAAILAADVVSFSKLIGEDEAGTLEALREIRRQIVNPILAEHHGLMFDDGRRRHACRATEEGRRMKARRDFRLDAPACRSATQERL